MYHTSFYAVPAKGCEHICFPLMDASTNNRGISMIHKFHNHVHDEESQ
jgi:hypothetical protein